MRRSTWPDRAQTCFLILSMTMVLCAPAIVSAGIPDAPVAGSVGYQVAGGTRLAVAAPGVLSAASDTVGDSVTATVVTPPMHGTLDLREDGSFDYVPDASFLGIDEFTFTASDGALQSAPATATITVVAVATRITLTSAAQSLPRGARYSLKGRLEGTQSGLGGQRILVQSSTDGSAWADAGVEAVTAGDGTFSAALLPSGKTYYRGVYLGDAVRLASQSASVLVIAKTSGQTAADIAKSLAGRRYLSGAIGPRRFDCSGLTLYVYSKLGVKLPRRAAEQYRYGRRVAYGSAQPGDLVFFYRGPSHVGIYIGNGMMVDCNHAGGKVAVRHIYPHLVGVRRLLAK
ncbi:MAG TPA: NlpC/P60 family protein [Coriobacteriia bacterium]